MKQLLKFYRRQDIQVTTKIGKFKKIEKVPIDIEITDDDLVRPKMVSVNNTVNENVTKQRVTKRKC